MDARIEIAKQELETLKQIGDMERERAAKLQQVIAAEREAKAALVSIKDEQAKRVATLERKLSRSRRYTLILGGVAVAGILIGVAR